MSKENYKHLHGMHSPPAWGSLRGVKNVRIVFAGGGVRHFYFGGAGYVVKGGIILFGVRHVILKKKSYKGYFWNN